MVRRSSSAPPHPSLCSRSRGEGVTLTPPGVACRLGPGELVTLAVFLLSHATHRRAPGAPDARAAHLRQGDRRKHGAEVPPVARRPVVAVYHAWGAQTRPRSGSDRFAGRINKCTHRCAIVCAMVRNACKRSCLQISVISGLSRKEAGSGRTARCAGVLRAERRRSRTYPAWGCQTSPVLKTGWATGPVPLHVRRAA